MPETKRTKAPSTRRAAKGGDVAVLEAEPALVSELDGLDGLDDILGEIAPPPKAEPVDDFDDILGELAEPVKTEPADDLDDILGELAEPAKAEPADEFDDILSELAEPVKAEPVDALDDILGEIAPATAAPATDLDDILSEISGPATAETAADLDFDDILGEIAGPAPTPPAADFDDILSELAGPATIPVEASLDDILGEVSGPANEPAPAGKAKASRKAAKPAEEVDDLSALLNEVAPPQPAAPTPTAPVDAPAIAGKAAKRGGSKLSLQGKREISRKAYFGLVGSVGLLALTTLGQAAFILTRPAAPAVGHGPAAHGAHASVAAPAIPLVPVDYSKMDLTRYRDKVRALGEGGRDMLRNPAIKEAIVALENGEELYEELRKLSRLSKAADLVSIGGDRLTINSCNLAVCSDKSFKLVYNLQEETASVCVTEKYLNGAYLSYSYSPEGYSEVPGCNGSAHVAAPPVPSEPEAELVESHEPMSAPDEGHH